MLLRYAFAALLVLAPSIARAQTPGSCDTGQANVELSLSDVRAGLFNTGALFFNGGNGQYEVPNGSGRIAIFAANLWVGGMVGGEVRTAAGTYAQGTGYEFWPGPLDPGGTLPDDDDCSAYDRFYRVTAPELAAYEAGRPATPALTEWPVGLGAPAVDAAGVAIVPTSREQTVDLEAGERPVVYGTETAFWVMNDVGGEHLETGTAPLGIEVRVSAFSINDPDTAVLDQSTFYRYEILNRSPNAIQDLRVGFWNDVDLGDFEDDYIGSDPGRSMFYAYNSDNDDGAGGYGTTPPAIGFDLLSGGAHGMYYESLTSAINGNPVGGQEFYYYLSGRWRNGQRWTYGFDALDTSQPVTDWMFDGDPRAANAFWSEFDTDPSPTITTPNQAGDRRGLLAATPVDLAPGASHTVDVAIVFARGTSNLDSVTELFAASDLVQARYDDGSLFNTTSGDLGLPPATAPALLSPADGTVFMPPERVTLDWTPVADADGYRIEYGTDINFQVKGSQNVDSPPVALDFSTLPQGTFEPIYWRVVPTNQAGDGPSSEARSFTYGFEFEAAVELLSNDQPAFLEVVGPGGADPCGDAAGSTFGCQEAGGNAVYVPNGETAPDANGTGAYTLTSRGDGPEGSLSIFAPNDFEIRFTAEGSIGYHPFADTPGRPTYRVPFEVWDIGIVPLGADGVPTANDPSDDVQLVPILFSDDAGNGNGTCVFEFGEIPAAESPLGVPLSDRIYAYYPTTTYADFEAAAAPLVAAATDGCYDDTGGDLQNLIDTAIGRPIGRVVVADLAGSGSIATLEGAVIRFHTTDPEPVAGEVAPTAAALALTIAPNPSRGAARVAFTLPTAGAVRVRLVDVLGREVARLADGEHAAGPHAVSMPVRLAAGVYVVTVEAGDARAVRALTVVR